MMQWWFNNNLHPFHIVPHNGDDDKALCASAPHFNVTLHNGDNDAFHIALRKASTNNKATCASAWYYHIALHNGDNNNNTTATTTYVINKPLVHRRMSFILEHIASPNGNNDKATMATTNKECQWCGLKRERTVCAGAKASSIDATINRPRQT